MWPDWFCSPNPIHYLQVVCWVIWPLSFLSPLCISGIFIPSHHQVGRTKWDKLHNALGTGRCSMNMSCLPLPLMPAAGRPHSTKKEAMFVFQTAGNPASQASTNNADLFLPQLMCVEYVLPVFLMGWFHDHRITDLFSFIAPHFMGPDWGKVAVL